MDEDRSGPNPRQNYLRIISILEGRAKLVAVATHDKKLAGKALYHLKDSGTPCEMEQLSSLPQNCVQLAKSLRVPVRLYIPFGYPSIPYNLRHANARPTIILCVLRDFFLGRRKHLSSNK